MRLRVNALMALIALFFAFSTLQAQIGWTEKIIDPQFDGAWGLSVYDMDGDGDIDLVGCAKNYDDVAWYENDGEQYFAKHIIDGDFNGANCVKAIDIDSDGDIDVLGTADGPGYDGLISWWENDGDMNFTPHSISSAFEYTHWADAADIDGDDDIDIVAVATWGHFVTWWENDGEENFTEHTIASNFRYPYFVSAIDLDNDDDMDLMVGAAYEELTWFENSGDQVFAPHSISSLDSCFTTSIAVADMDDDGDLDVLATELWRDDVYWFVNDGSQNFYMLIIDYNYNGAYSVEAADIDNDGDMDAIGAAWDDDAISWWEHNENDTFTRHDLTNSFSYARRAIPVDMDGDGALDIVGTGERADKICWWESDLVTSIADHANPELPDGIALLQAYPNPFNANTTISYTLSSPRNVIIDIFDLQGRKLQTLVDRFEQAGLHKINFDASDLASGYYIYHLQAGDYSESKRMILLK